jgi:hypothetical protein
VKGDDGDLRDGMGGGKVARRLRPTLPSAGGVPRHVAALREAPTRGSPTWPPLSAEPTQLTRQLRWSSAGLAEPSLAVSFVAPLSA